MEFAIAFAALFAAHQVGDHWFGQSHHEALTKGGVGEHSHEGRRAASSHAFKMGLHSIAFLGLAELVTGVHFTAPQFVLAVAINTASHYLIDRRWTLEWVANRTGKGDFYRLGAGQGHLGTGAYALDQSAHILFVFISALVLGV